MKHKNFITTLLLTISVIFLLTPARAQDPPALFDYNISTAEAFYFVQFASIDGSALDTNDWIGAFNGDICVGSVQWSGEFTEVPVMGDDGDINSDGYMLPGQFPEFMIYDASDNQYYNAEPSENFGWANFEFYFITYLDAIIPDCYGTPGGTAFYDDCGQCVGGETGQQENWAMDDCGVCFGYNGDMDCNGDCFGFAYMDDCDVCSEGFTGHPANSDMDCNNECFGTAFIDDCSECVGGATGMQENWAMDDCSVCFGDNADMDCNGDCFGTAFIDDCEICSEGDTGHPANSDMDCADECFGDHITDVNAACCLTEELDFCGLCFGENQCPGNGDVNGDGSLDVLDAVRLISIIMMQITPTDYELWTADLIWDGSVDVLDAVNLISLIMGG
ncbi:MAG: hypothetical protein GXO91_00745 [FCB group bacterium]|nr:hypothetical protein [FCB group bacterium]